MEIFRYMSAGMQPGRSGTGRGGAGPHCSPHTWQTILAGHRTVSVMFLHLARPRPGRITVVLYCTQELPTSQGRRCGPPRWPRSAPPSCMDYTSWRAGDAARCGTGPAKTLSLAAKLRHATPRHATPRTVSRMHKQQGLRAAIRSYALQRDSVQSKCGAAD